MLFKVGILDDEFKLFFKTLINTVEIMDVEICEDVQTDLFVITENSEIPQNEFCCECLLVPGSIARKFSGKIKGRYAVSYGTSMKDSISLSSVEKGKIGVSIQREIVTLYHEIVEPQEFFVKQLKNVSMKEMIALLGCSLILGEKQFYRVFGISRDKLA